MAAAWALGGHPLTGRGEVDDPRPGDQVSGAGGFLQAGARLGGPDACAAGRADELVRRTTVAGTAEVAVFDAVSEVTGC